MSNNLHDIENSSIHESIDGNRAAKGNSKVANSAANRVAAGLRNRIIDGDLVPGQRLTEEIMRADFSVSRSTLREGFQLLIRERLLVHRLSRGFFVRELNEPDIVDLFFTRRVIECGALRTVRSLDPQHLQRLFASVDTGQEAAARADWQQTAAASIDFHRAIVALANSRRLDDLIAQVLVEFRLSYGLMADPLAFHVRFLERNAGIVDTISRGQLEQAAIDLENYLNDSEAQLVELFRPTRKTATDDY